MQRCKDCGWLLDEGLCSKCHGMCDACGLGKIGGHCLGCEGGEGGEESEEDNETVFDHTTSIWRCIFCQ